MRSILDQSTPEQRANVAMNMKKRGQAINAEIRSLLSGAGLPADALDMKYRCDKCREPEELIELTGAMMIDFAERMAEIRKENSASLHVRRTIDYIYRSLGGKLTLQMAAEHEHLHPSYLSKLFSREMGMPIKAYILQAKITTAQNILTFSDFSIAEIADSLGFSSQSAFTAAFRRITGMTPFRYRNRYSEEHVLYPPERTVLQDPRHG